MLQKLPFKKFDIIGLKVEETYMTLTLTFIVWI